MRVLTAGFWCSAGCAVAGMAIGAGCGAQPQPATPVRRVAPALQPTTAPASRPQALPASAPATAPATSSAPASQPTTTSAPASQPTTTSAPAEIVDTVPKFLRVGEKSDLARAAKITAEVGAGRLTIDTENVNRLEIRRDLLNLPTNRSTILHLDGQVIEWLANSKVTEFQRSTTGVWTPVRPGERKSR